MFFKNKASYLFFLFTFYTVLPQAPGDEKDMQAPIVYSYSHIISDIKQRQKLSKSRLIAIPAIVCATLLFNKNSIIESAKNSPIPFIAASCFLSNYIIDTFYKYQTINQTLDFFIFSQKMSHYMLCAMILKNTMSKKDEFKNINFKEEEFLTTIALQTGYSFEELEQLTIELLNNSLLSINGLCFDINTTELGEKVYFLFKDKVSMSQMLILSKDDKRLHNALLKFYTNPEKEYQDTLTTICSLLKNHLETVL